MSALVDRDLAVYWHPCSQMRDFQDFPPLEIVGARGARIQLAGGGEIIDAISSWWCKSLGHGHAGVRARIAQQLDHFEHVIAANTTHVALVELCERLLLMANGGGGATPTGHFGKVFLADNGSTAVEIAMKMALQAQSQKGQSPRTQFASLSGGYHGETIATLSAGDLGLYADPYRPLMFPVHKIGPIPYRTGVADPRWQDAGPEWAAIESALLPRAQT
ncbi:MAG: aminotransferase class III-fold pyridoxal phosphate-dependent enzyme, partial [Deltaproteobacteria bacterium]|nr:aminotransferase class III-fold pyridoxal phosphate-dependent enzyme [Deltaproteobacteria bacterium]